MLLLAPCLFAFLLVIAVVWSVVGIAANVARLVVDATYCSFRDGSDVHRR